MGGSLIIHLSPDLPVLPIPLEPGAGRSEVRCDWGTSFYGCHSPVTNLRGVTPVDWICREMLSWNTPIQENQELVPLAQSPSSYPASREGCPPISLTHHPSKQVVKFSKHSGNSKTSKLLTCSKWHEDFFQVSWNNFGAFSSVLFIFASVPSKCQINLLKIRVFYHVIFKNLS